MNGKGGEMKAEDLRIQELVEFADGTLSLHGRRLVLHDINAFAQFRRDLVEMVGLEQTRRILTRFGYFWGQADAAAMKRIFTWDSPAEWLMAGPRMHALQGVARVVVKRMEMDPEAGRLAMDVVWHDSGEAEEHMISLGGSDVPVCWMLVGYASGYATFCLGREVYFVEQSCRAQGNRVCTAVGKDRDSWGPELTPHLPYFQADDIHGKILQLSEELQARTRELARERRRVQALTHNGPAGLVEVHSESFRRVLDLAARVAPFDTSLLVTGETGVGKEVLARHIHRLSNRAGGPFLGVNCTALPDTLLESELFGHKAGSFTGAVRNRIGLFEEAQSGTIFLDEIGDVSPAMQMKLLRVLQEKEITRVGESKPRKVDVRIIAATNRDLMAAVRAGRFREDLFYRLRVIPVEVPPLRERREDILHLARHFVGRFAKSLGKPGLRLDATCVDYLQAHRWPGNVRELENAVERAAVLSRDGVIRPHDLPPEVTHGPPSGEPSGDSLTLAEVEERHVRAALEKAGGNRTRAAEALGISPSTLWRRLKRMEDERR